MQCWLFLADNSSDVYYSESCKNCSGGFEVNSLKMFSFHVISIYTHAKLNFLVTIYTLNH